MSRNERKDIAVMTSLPYNDSLDDIENIPRPIIRHQRLIKVKYDLHNAYICDIPVSKQPNICIKRRHIRRNIKAKSVLCNSLNQNRSSIPTNQNLKNCLGSLNNTRNPVSIGEIMNKMPKGRTEILAEILRMRPKYESSRNSRNLFKSNGSRDCNKDIITYDRKCIQNNRPKSNLQRERPRNLYYQKANMILREQNAIINAIPHNTKNMIANLPHICDNKRNLFSNNVLKRNVAIEANEENDDKENIPIEVEESPIEDLLCAKYI